MLLNLNSFTLNNFVFHSFSKIFRVFFGYHVFTQIDGILKICDRVKKFDKFCEVVYTTVKIVIAHHVLIQARRHKHICRRKRLYPTYIL